MMSSLYEQLGGSAAVDAAVDLFYRKVLADGRINHFFQGVDLRRLAGHQRAFLAMAAQFVRRGMERKPWLGSEAE